MWPWPSHGHTFSGGVPLSAHHIYLPSEAEAWRDQLRISNLSAYLRVKLQEDVRKGSPLKNLRAELDVRREELRHLEEAFEAKALETEETLQLFESAAHAAREVVANTRYRTSVQTTLIRWLHNHPLPQKLREVLPSDFADQRFLDVLLRWPESKAEVQVLVEASS